MNRVKPLRLSRHAETIEKDLEPPSGLRAAEIATSQSGLHLRGRVEPTADGRFPRQPQGADGDQYATDPEPGVAPGVTRSRNMRSRCQCSMCPAIHINSRSWLRSSSTHEPSDPPLRVVSLHNFRCTARIVRNR